MSYIRGVLPKVQGSTVPVVTTGPVHSPPPQCPAPLGFPNSELQWLQDQPYPFLLTVQVGLGAPEILLSAPEPAEGSCSRCISLLIESCPAGSWTQGHACCSCSWHLQTCWELRLTQRQSCLEGQVHPSPATVKQVEERKLPCVLQERDHAMSSPPGSRDLDSGQRGDKASHRQESGGQCAQPGRQGSLGIFFHLFLLLSAPSPSHLVLKALGACTAPQDDSRKLCIPPWEAGVSLQLQWELPTWSTPPT
uniref:Uncharacterized protein LOC109698825 n=1 Tax=Castor canadensis TaxID=51338 RepID=A0A8B7W4F7_CASCN|nr:uncharacterized protein LOC109698825 [Castor canadensis]